ncbi:F-BAR domain only protein 2-like isoform X4 [Dermacentor silvarum]|uniref:F-BAR domain only protein 2-like isoform X4 n=1 Tax=Dermacentor silvarum TaxID=543639 RepID=UPI002101648D|nr:F-BAR domain only protein 2-like isoform X4 [Dermacentor silvarum]
MTVDFRDYFWGEKNNGFDVLYHNMKYGYLAAKDLAEFFRERSLVEESHSKLLSKLARQAAGSCSTGTFGPLWGVLRSTSEKLSSLHAQMVAQLQDLVREVQRYCEEQHRRHKQVKEEEAPTLEVVQGLQQTTGALAKAREAYAARCLELEKLRRESSPKDLDKAEAKARKACEEYRQLVERHGVVRADFERRMAGSCQRFQELEVGHLQHMKEFLAGYARVLDSSHALVGQVHAEFRQQCDALDIDTLLRQFAAARQTGSEKPEAITFEEPDPSLQLTPTNAGATGSPPFFTTSTPAPTASSAENGPVLPADFCPAAAAAAPAPSSAATNGPQPPAAKKEGKGRRHRAMSLLDLFFFSPSLSATKTPAPSPPPVANNNINATATTTTAAHPAAPAAGKLHEIQVYMADGTVQQWQQKQRAGGHGGGSGGFLRTKWERQKEKRKRKKEMSSKDASTTSGEAARAALGRAGGSGTLHEPSPPCERSALRRLSVEQPRAASDLDSLFNVPVPTATASVAPVPTRDSKESEEQNAEVDEEGYTVRPSSERHKENDRDSFYSSSDGDSDDEERDRRIHIEIKPLSNGAPMSASVDELRATIGSLSLSPIPQHSSRRPETLYIRHKARRAYNSASSTPDEAPKRPANQSSKDSAGIGSGTEADMLGMFPLDTSASTPTTRLQSPLGQGEPASQPSASSSVPSWDRYAALSDLFNDKAPADLSSSEASKGATTSRGGTPTSAFTGPALPRPPSRRSEAVRGRASPLPMSRTESVGSLSSDFKTTPMPLGSSRGPSPLTIGLCDSIPLAIAFQEVVHARFRGTDETLCQVKLLGDMKVSFPAGIVHVLTNNPSPATLTFRVNTARFDNVLPNKNLITLDASQSTSDRCVYEFNMSLLTGLLRRQHEQTPSASYFNIDILKYHVRAGPGARSAPLHLVAYWKTQEDNTNLKIDYEYNAKALSLPAGTGATGVSQPASANPAPSAPGLPPLTGLCLGVPMDGGVTSVQAKPSCVWNGETQRALWRLNDPLGGTAGSQRGGSVLARFAL